MGIAAAMFNVAAWGMEKNDSPSNMRKSWLIVGWSTLLFFGSISWLVMNYRYTQRSWWRLVGPGGSSSGAATGFAILLSDAKTLLPMAYGMWAWTVANAVVLSVDSRGEDYAAGDEELDVPEYAIGTPHDPRVRSQQRQQGV